jgi:hypothetical protein
MTKKFSYNIIMLILTILSILLAILFYLKSIKTKSISYYTTDPSIIYDSKIIAPSLKLSDSNNRPITNDVMVSYFILWNSGDLPINKDDIRKRIELTINGPAEIYNYSVSKESNQDISHFQIKLINKNIEEQFWQYEISWDYFDPSFSVKFQFICSYVENINYNLSGNILNIDKFNNIKPIKDNSLSIYFYILSFGFIICLVFLGITNKPKSIRLIVNSISILIIILIFVLIFKGIFKNPKIPLMFN